MRNSEEKNSQKSPLKVVIKPAVKADVKKETEPEIDEDAKRLAEEAAFVRMVLDDEEKRQKKIDRNFRKSRKEVEISETISKAERYEADYETGLSAEQVAHRKEEQLVNVATQKNRKTYLGIFIQNICTFFNLVCIIVAIALIVVGRWEDLTFMVIVTFNMVIGIIQECRSKRVIDRLSIVSAPVAVVQRDGETQTVPVEDVVLDDIMYLENGKQICADAVVVRGKIQVNEAMLTGESALVTKVEGDVLYAGSFVASGNCHARVEKVGNANYIESLTSFAKRYKKAGSELLHSVQKLISGIGILIVPLAVLIFMTNFRFFGNSQIDDVFSYTAGAIIGMIPAGMFLLTTVALAVGMLRLARNHVLVQDMYCIEMLARTDVLCLDKTGTITDGTMNVSQVIPIRQLVTGVSLDDVMSSFLVATGDNNQTAIALVNQFGTNAKLKPVTVMPFSSQKKLSAVTFEGEGTFILGAPEFVMPEMDVKLSELVEAKAKEGLRVLMVAQSMAEIRGERLPAGRKCIALICIEDHIREDACATIDWFKNNDVAVRVISGDNPVTVSEVARRAGIENADKYISLEGLSDQEVIEVANRYTVFGRVTPEQKRLLVRAIKMKGHTVAMTGDGVNDILALKEANCSVAMATGSEAARNVSHMVLMDSNFGNMPTVVLEGRRIINNIQKSSSLYTMKTLFSILLSVIVVVLGLLGGQTIHYPITPSSLLLLEMFIIGAPSFFLAFQPNKERIKGHFLSNLFRETVPNGLALVLGFMSLYVYAGLIGLDVDDPMFITMTVLIVTFTGWTLLIKLCQPLNMYRATLVGLCGAFVSGVISLSIVSAPEGFFRTMIHVGTLDLTNALFVIVAVMFSYVAASTLAMLINALVKSRNRE